MPARLDPGAVHTITKLSNSYPVHDLLLSSELFDSSSRTLIHLQLAPVSSENPHRNPIQLN